VLADLKEREPQYKALAKRVALREAGGRSAKRRAEKALAGGAGGTGSRRAASAAAAAGSADADAGPAREAADPPAPAGRPASGVSGRPYGEAGRGGTLPADQDSGQGIDAAEAGYADEPEDVPPADEQEAAASATDWVPAGQGTSRVTPAPGGVRPGPRQQPRRTTAAGRRPGGKKKKR
jgi:hypothetical protein